MFWAELAVVLIFILIGARLGGVGIAYAGASGVIVLGLLGCRVDPTTGIPWDVLGIIIAVISCVAALQACGGLDLLIMVSERMLRRSPRRITLLAPVVTFLMTVLCGTGHVAFATLPVIAEVAKEQRIRPSRPLSIAVVASQVAIAASPISAAMIAMASAVEPLGIGYLPLVGVSILICFIGCMAGALVASRLGCELEDDPVYQERMAAGLVATRGEGEYDIKPYARRSVLIFTVALVVVMAYAALSSGIGAMPMGRNAAIMTTMMLAALLMRFTCRMDLGEVSNQSTFRGGMSAALCILGVAWLGNTFVNSNLDLIEGAGRAAIQGHPWLLAVVLFLASALLYSQGATTATFMPVAAAMGVGGAVMAASFPAVTGLYLLPTYPTTVAAIEMDDTGSTRIGEYVFNHPFILPGITSVVVAVGLGFLICQLVF
ncbi:anaerobic C4-dicarboxylate transporter [uncultured Propionibacterium sp.]|uniref:anaerobic C4-dicarboxylate transporter n=1 Tax=uncultured Propionibacterium sp. TaxID=218066 RepID=UPI00292F88A1|nr:anaerobic C4-dicarboxylate transporter [uncultured Propionibacterium sp.]